MIHIANFFIPQQNTPANIAKERLKIIISEHRLNDNMPNYLRQLKQDIINVISKYEQIHSQKILFQFRKIDPDTSTLKFNITLHQKK